MENPYFGKSMSVTYRVPRETPRPQVIGAKLTPDLSPSFNGK